MPKSTDTTKLKLAQEEMSDSKIEVIYWVYINTETDGEICLIGTKIKKRHKINADF